MLLFHTHSKPADCNIDPDTRICIECGVDHSDPCPWCEQTGFHHPDCLALMVKEAREDLQKCW